MRIRLLCKSSHQRTRVERSVHNECLAAKETVIWKRSEIRTRPCWRALRSSCPVQYTATIGDGNAGRSSCHAILKLQGSRFGWRLRKLLLSPTSPKLCHALHNHPGAEPNHHAKFHPSNSIQSRRTAINKSSYRPSSSLLTQQ